MTRILACALLALALAGCQSAPKSTPETPATQASGAGGPDAPVLIASLTNQTTVWECPKCGMNFDRAGTCSMGCAELVEMKVDYTCPADNKPVESAGKCPRCPMNARVQKTALAAVVEGK